MWEGLREWCLGIGKVSQGGVAALGFRVAGGVGTCTIRYMYERTKVDAEKLMKRGRVDTGLWENSSIC